MFAATSSVFFRAFASATAASAMAATLNTVTGIQQHRGSDRDQDQQDSSAHCCRDNLRRHGEIRLVTAQAGGLRQVSASFPPSQSGTFKSGEGRFGQSACHTRCRTLFQVRTAHRNSRCGRNHRQRSVREPHFCTASLPVERSRFQALKGSETTSSNII